MQRKIHQSLTVFMVFLILLSSTGFGFIEHECMMRGKSVQFLAEKQTGTDKKKAVSSCCAKSKVQKESKGTFFKKTDCCKDNTKFEKVDVTSSLAQIQAKALKVMSDGIIWSSQSFVFIVSEWILPSDESFLSISFSSLLHGRSMLVFVQSFLI